MNDEAKWWTGICLTVICLMVLATYCGQEQRHRHKKEIIKLEKSIHLRGES